MKAIAQKEIMALISDINAFADSAETLITNTQSAYDREKQNLQTRHSSALSGLESSYQNACTALGSKSQETINDAKRIMAEITKLDEKLSAADKYYVKTKKKKEQELAGKTSSNYANAADYFHALKQIRESFNVLFKKYTEDILPGLINGLNYLFSGQRKKDYEELIVLRNTVSAFVREIERELPAITGENLKNLENDFLTQKSSLTERQNREAEDFEKQYLITLDKVAGKICEELDEILPDEFAAYLDLLMNRYAEGVFKVNTTGEITDEVFHMTFAEYPVDFFVQSPIVASVIMEKCGKLLDGRTVKLPLAMSVSDAPVWMIVNDGSGREAVQDFMHSVMFGMLSAVPVSGVVYSIVDPENRGSSISPFFEARKKLPELFGEKIYVNSDDIASKVGRLNEYIEGVVQDKLGSQYGNIFEYAKDHGDFTVQAELVVVFDFPKGFEERTLDELRNILRNGSRCGVYTIISYLPDTEGIRSREYERNLKAVAELTRPVMQNGKELVMRGLPLRYVPMPEKAEFAGFFSKYMLIFEGMKNRGIAFPPLIKKLADAKDASELEAHISRICDMTADYEKGYARVPETGTTFPALVMLGTVLYPADIFSDSVGYGQILDRFGAGSVPEGETGYVELPLTFDLGNSFNLLLNCPETGSRNILAFTHHVMWSFLSFMPVTKINICVFDGEQRGNSIIPFLDFRRRCPEIFDQKIYTAQDAMTERLREINVQIDEFIQEKLGNKYRDILEYNRNTPNRAEPVTLLVLYDFPAGMEAGGLDLLMNILRNGNKCGVFTVICHNPDVFFSKYERMEERLENISRYCTWVDFKEDRYVLLPYNLQLKIPGPLSDEEIDGFIRDYTDKSEAVRKKGLAFQDILQDKLFAMSSAKSLSIPVGIGDGDAVVNMVIGEGSSHHGLIAGATGSGKSTLLHTIIMSSMLHYSPDQLHLYLMDFKSGTEFKIYESVRLPHIQLLALDAMQEFGESILENLVKEMESRGSLFKEAGQTNLKGYRKETGRPMPRILVIMDEFQILFNDSANRKVAMNCAELTKRIVTEGRAFGIHLLMATQSTKVISDLTLSHGTMEQMRIRVGLKCGESDARYLFSDENEAKALSMMKGPVGTAVMNLDYTEQANIGMRTACCDDDTRKQYLRLISETFAHEPYTLQTFEGGRTVKLLDYYRMSGLGRTQEIPVKIHMGSLIKVAPSFAVTVDKKKKHNLLVCGANERMANSVADNYMISALLNGNASVYCMDGELLVGENTSQALYETLLTVTSRFRLARDRGEIIGFIRDVYKKYREWKKQNSSEVVFVVMKNLQFLDIIKTMFKGERLDESEYMEDGHTKPDDMPSADPFAAINNMFADRESEENLSAGEKLIKLIEDGSGFGIHFVVMSLEYQTVRETMYYGENLLTKFPERIIFSMGNSEAENLIENVSVTGLRDNTVYFTDGVKNTFQMKPYIPPAASELRDFMGPDAELA